MTPVTWEVSTR